MKYARARESMRRELIRARSRFIYHSSVSSRDFGRAIKKQPGCKTRTARLWSCSSLPLCLTGVTCSSPLFFTPFTSHPSFPCWEHDVPYLVNTIMCALSEAFDGCAERGQTQSCGILHTILTRCLLIARGSVSRWKRDEIGRFALAALLEIIVARPTAKLADIIADCATRFGRARVNFIRDVSVQFRRMNGKSDPISAHRAHIYVYIYISR